MHNIGSFSNQYHLKWFPYLAIIAMRGGYPRPTNELDTVTLTLSELSFRYLNTSFNSLMRFVERGSSVLWSLLAISFVTLSGNA